MSELLNAIELEPRIHTKEVEIERSTANATAINVKITIATPRTKKWKYPRKLRLEEQKNEYIYHITSFMHALPVTHQRK